jgi:hypothetical protein
MIKLRVIDKESGKAYRLGLLGNELRGFSERARRDVFDVMRAKAMLIRNEVIEGMTNSPPTGKMYSGGGRRAPHFASSPGNPPRRDFGNLVASIVMDVDEGEGTIDVGSNLEDPPYGAYLEFGVAPHGRHPGVEARPWLWPVLKRREGDINTEVMDAIKAAAAMELKG